MRWLLIGYMYLFIHRPFEIWPTLGDFRIELVFALLAGFVPTAAMAGPPPKLPDPTYKSISKEVLVTMDDGVKIATTVGFPSVDGTNPASFAPAV